MSKLPPYPRMLFPLLPSLDVDQVHCDHPGRQMAGIVLVDDRRRHAGGRCRIFCNMRRLVAGESHPDPGNAARFGPGPW